MCTTVVDVSALQTVKDLGEFALIDAIAQRLGTSTSTHVQVGPGDDAAVVTVQGSSVVSCVDIFVQGVHFRLDWSGAYDIGQKIVAANLADIVAMGGAPTSLLVGLAIPATTEVSWVLELADGMKAEADKVGAVVIGGDIASSDQIMLSVTAFGDLNGTKPILRSGAQVGDVVAVAGQLGYAQAGLLLLSRGFRSPRSIVNAHRAPQPPYELAQAATHAHSMVDVSDGLLSDVGHIARASHVAINVDSKAIEIPEELESVASAFNGDLLSWVLNGGEDHAFVATFGSTQDVPQGWNIIGSVTDGDGVVTVDGEVVEATGWQHFG